MLTTTVTSNSALAGVNEMKAVDQHQVTQAARNPQQLNRSGPTPAQIANLHKRLLKNSWPQYCGTFNNGTVYNGGAWNASWKLVPEAITQ